MAYSQRSITVNLRPALDRYVRSAAKRNGVSMNAIINDAMDAYRRNGGIKNGKIHK